MASTLLILRSDVLAFLNDLQDTVNGTGDRFNTVNLNRVINRVIRHYTRVVNKFYQGYFSQQISIDLLADTTGYALGDDFRSPIYEVRRTINSMNYFLEERRPYQMNITTTSVDNSSYVPTYYLSGNSIVFNSPPTTAETAGVIVTCQSKLVDLENDTDELDEQLYDLEEAIILRSVIWALKGKDVSGALKNISGFEKELLDIEREALAQIGTRYVIPEKPIYTDYDSDYYS